MRSSLERELKFDVEPSFVLPDLGEVDGLGLEVRPPVKLEAVYYDTPAHDLLAWGATLRYRTSDGTAGRWTLKLPAASDDAGMAERHEVDFDGVPGEVPAEVRNLVHAYLREAELAPMATLVTVRRRASVLDDESGAAPLAEVDDDTVDYRTDGQRGTFREVEVELDAQASDKGLARLVKALERAGARRADGGSKLARALGPEVAGRVAASGPGRLPGTSLRLGRRSSLGDVVASTVAAGLVRLLAHDPGVRLGADPEDLHQARVATRRLRSDLRTLGELLEREWVDQVRSELADLGRTLGRVRDDDVLAARLGTLTEGLSEADRPEARKLLDRIAAQRDAHRAELIEVMESFGYWDLVDTLTAAAESPPSAVSTAEAAALVRPLLQRRWSKLVQEVHGLGQAPADAALHRVRIQAKRCRYASELCAPVLGRQAARLAKALASLQAVLGDLQDAVVAEDWLRDAAAEAPLALVAGQLIAAERGEAAAARGKWRASWHKVETRADWLD
ncbi:MAG TPA: CYTH and CHAD domain-containing protein [Acidimicrobiales bacterium]|nr:CYTH and CHAD domain-containing protein [Acidimicrobiales bacterium]